MDELSVIFKFKAQIEEIEMKHHGWVTDTTVKLFLRN